MGSSRRRTMWSSRPFNWLTLTVFLVPWLTLSASALRIRQNLTASPRYLIDTGGGTPPLQLYSLPKSSPASSSSNSDDDSRINSHLSYYPQAQYYSTETPTSGVLTALVIDSSPKTKSKTAVRFNDDEEQVYGRRALESPEYTSLVEEDDGEEAKSNEAYSSSYEDSTPGDLGREAQTTTIRSTAGVVPAGLRRNNFGRLVEVDEGPSGPFRSLEALSDIVLPPKPGRKKTKPSKLTTRRRKVKRPIGLASTTEAARQVAGAPNSDLELNTNSSVKDDGEKQLAVEILSPDGKYALIQNFFNQTGEKTPPGVLSYKPSEQFPKVDNIQTLGHLGEDDIWLADGHLLVIKGGNFDDDNKTPFWPPIDNYQRKKEPVLRIPLDTDNPPPFPVFVNKSGPPVFLREPPPFLPYPPPGFNDTNFDPSLFPPPGMVPLNPNGTIPLFPFPPPGSQGGFGGGGGRPIGPGGGRPLGPGFGGGVNGGGRPGGVNGGLYGGGPPSGGGVYGGGSPPPGFRLPPPPGFNGSFPPPPFAFPPPGGFNGSLPPGVLPPPPGFNPFGPPGANGSLPPNFPPFAPPPLVLNADNETDDPTIFLPPPYDFDYFEDNSTLVPPGPFAPGLVVPPPRDFYTVYNRTGRPPTSIRTSTPRPFFFPTSTAIPTTVEAVVTSPVSPPGFTPKKQRPNGKKPKFPLTNPPDDSLEELYHRVPPSTTPMPPPAFVEVVTATKKRKKPKKPFFPADSTSDYSSEDDEIARVAPPSTLKPRRPSSIVFPISARGPVSPSSPTTPVSQTTTASPIQIYVVTEDEEAPPALTTPKNNFVYIRGQLKSLEELRQAKRPKVPQGPPTPAPPFDERGYPTRVTEDDQPPIIFEYTPQKVQHSTPLTPIRNRKPTETPTKTYYTGTPKYNPQYVPTYSSNGKPPQLQHQHHQQVHPQQPHPTPVVYEQAQPVYPSNQPPTPVRQRPFQQYHQERITPPQQRPPHHQPPQRPQHPHLQYQQVGPAYSVAQEEDPSEAPPQEPPNPQYFLPQTPIRKRPKTTRLRPINPTSNEVHGYQQQQHQPQQPLEPVYHNQPQVNGFRPAYPPPQQHQHQPQQPSPTPSIIFRNEPSPPNRGNRILFNNDEPIRNLRPQQPVNTQFYHHNNNPNAIDSTGGSKISNFPPNGGYFSPITNFYQPANGGSGQFLPNRFPTPQSQRVANNNNNFNPYSLQSLPVTERFPNSNQQAHAPFNVFSGNDAVNFQQLFASLFPQQHQQQQQQFSSPPNNQQQSGRLIQAQSPYNNFVPQSTPQSFRGNQFVPHQQQQQQFQPLFDDIRVNYREPLPLYNTESEAVAPVSSSSSRVVKAGPAPAGGASSSKDKTQASGSSPAGTFYSFERGGPGGFSYKIRLR